MTKTVNIAPKPTRTASQDWVEHRKVPKEPRPTKRLTLDIDAELHRRMRLECVAKGLVMADEIRLLLEQRFPTKTD